MWKAFICNKFGNFSDTCTAFRRKRLPLCPFLTPQWPGFICRKKKRFSSNALQSSSSRAAGVCLFTRNVRSDEGMALSCVEPIAFPPLLASDTPPEYDYLLYHRLESGAWVWVSARQIKRKNNLSLRWAKKREERKSFLSKKGRFLLLLTTGVENSHYACALRVIGEKNSPVSALFLFIFTL